MEQRKTIKRLLQEKEELKKQLALYGVVGRSEQLPFNKCRDGLSNDCKCKKVDDCINN